VPDPKPTTPFRRRVGFYYLHCYAQEQRALGSPVGDAIAEGAEHARDHLEGHDASRVNVVLRMAGVPS
jgi:hypothetical protein